LRVALREEDFARVLGAGLLLIVIGTVTYSLGAGWSPVDGFTSRSRRSPRRASSIRSLPFSDPWLKIFTAGYVLVGIGILVEVARRLGMAFITARKELEQAKATAKMETADPKGSGNAA
jgi:hypothetical protein